MSTPLEGLLLERIREKGAMPFAAYMQFALYHSQHGYYSGGKQRTGWSGHFVTSPEVDPAFGELWATGFEEIWRRAGAPGNFEVVEIGPGEGGFAAAVLTAVNGDFAAALRYNLVERVAANEDRQRASLERFRNVRWFRSVAEVRRFSAGCWFANEVLDNLPAHLIQRDGDRILEVCVTEREGTLAFELRPPANPELERFLERCGIELADGQRVEVPLAAESMMAHIASRFERGAAIFVDYGLEASELANRPLGTVVCYSANGTDDLPLAAPGTKDITLHANWTSLRRASESAGLASWGPVDQREVLKNLGLAEIHRRLQDDFQSATSRGEGALALRSLSRRQALGVLADRGGLGGLGVVVAGRGIEMPSFMAGREGAGPEAGSWS